MNSQAVRVCEKNKKVLEYQGAPIILVCATEHYGSVLNRPFNFEAYLKDCKEKNQNYTRLFLLVRELQTKENPYSPAKPESTDYVSPFMRVGPGMAVDMLPKYDLEVWNDEFFERLHCFMDLAQKYDVIVEVVLFSNQYQQPLFDLVPWSSKNNINGTEDIDFNVALSMKAPKLFAYQQQYVEKVVTELNRYPNFFFEVCNEPGCFNPQLVGVDDINAWQSELIKMIRMLEKGMPSQHLIAGEDCFTWFPGEKLIVGTDYSFRDMDIDIVNIHPLENMMYCGKSYDLGEFMSKRLCLEEYKAFCLDTYNENKVVNIDEDNVASRFRDYDGWTIHRKRAWTAVMCGAHYDYIDFSIQVMCPTGTPDSQKHVRSWFKYLQNYIASMGLANCRPLEGCVRHSPNHTMTAAMGAAGEEYHIYIVDTRELTYNGYGTQIDGVLILDLEPGEYIATIYSPEFGQSSVGMKVQGGSETEVLLPPFVHDAVLRIQKNG